MAKAGMRRPDPADPKNHGTENDKKPVRIPNNITEPVPEIQGKAKYAHKKDVSI